VCLGHEILTYGYYAAVMDNGPATKSGHAKQLQEVGDVSIFKVNQYGTGVS
jgi:hypothetical protein